MEIGTVVKLVDQSQFQHVVHIGAIKEFRHFNTGMHARLYRWPLWVPVSQLIPVKGALS